MQAYKFSEMATETKPNTELISLFEKAAIAGNVLTRADKDQIACALYGLFGAQGPIYKLAGWAWPMDSCLPRILVRFNYEPRTFHTYYAPDKTSLRKCLAEKSSILEMIYA
jgi:hypothetical protein